MNGRGTILRQTARAALIAGLVAGGVGSFVPAAAFAQEFRFNTVAVEGNERVDTATIIAYAGIGQGETVTAGQLNDAYQRIVASGLFESVEIAPSGSRLNISVQEYPTISRINIEGNKRLTDENLITLLTSQSRRVYNPADAEADAAAITAAYVAQGRLSASVEPRIIRRSDNRVDLVFEVAEGGIVEVQRISFVGNQKFSERRLRNAIQTSQAGLFHRLIRSDTFIEERIAFDRSVLTDFYASRGYVDFQVLSVNSQLTRQRDGVFLTFNVREGQQFRLGNVTASSELPEVEIADFIAAIKADSGDIYSPSLLENNIARLERLAVDQQLNFVRVVPVVERNNAAGTLDVNFVLERGPRIFVERIDIEGNSTTLDRVIRRQFDSAEGDPFNPREIRQSAERIRALGFFSNADVSTRQGSNENQVIVDVDVEEAPTGSLSFGGTYSVQDGVGLSVDLSERNFLGRGQAVSLSYSGVGDDRSALASFSDPAFLGRDITFSLSGGYDTSIGPHSSYKTEVIDLRMGLEFPVSENGRLGFEGSVGQANVRDVSTSSSPILQREAGERFTHSLGYSYTYDTRRTGLDPNSGVFLRFDQAISGIGTSNQVLKTTGLASAETKVWNEEMTLRFDLEGGAVAGISGGSPRITDRFFPSNNQFRGWKGLGVGPRDTGATNNDALGGNYFAVARAESQFPLGLPDDYNITGGLFMDVGSVWGLDDTAGATGTVDDAMHIRATIGFSVYWTTGLGPLRFNFSKPLAQETYDQDANFDLTISTRF